MTVSQKDVIRAMLQRGPTCGSVLLEERFPRYAARIHELRGEGMEISTRRCENPWHAHVSRQVEYVLEDERIYA